MRLKDISFSSPQENILYDEVLLYLAEKDEAGEVLRFWESPEYFVVLGRISKERDDVNFEAVNHDNVPVLRRSSGGGTVLQGKGCLNFTLILSKEKNKEVKDLRRSYQFILDKIITSLKHLGVDAVFYPVSDIALIGNKKKISGNAQKRSKKFILHHGTILYDFDIHKIERYLNVPVDVPEYRQDRSHLDFVANVPVSVEDIKKEIQSVFDAQKTENKLSSEERKCLKKFLESNHI